ncbi:MAG TPA: M48 family metallopeptidase [Candidatus Dormibacteraeota bacterium]|nr:M48 family metallopeptidase [Candidatus Dormibacteraeota bacterium]
MPIRRIVAGAFFAALICVSLPALSRPPRTEAPATRSALQQAPARQTPPPSATPSATEPIRGYTLPPDKYREAVAYSNAQNWLYFAGFAYGLGMLLLVLAWRLAPRYRDWAERSTRHRLGQAAIFVPLIFFTLALLDIPIDVAGEWIELRFHLSIEPWGAWFWDWTKAELLTCLLGIVLVWILYGAIRRSPRRWWLYFWLALLPILCFLIFLSPYVIEPLFFRYQPLAKSDPALVAELEKVSAHAGVPIPPTRMFLMRASSKTTALNAYVSGFGASKRVVVWDTTIAKMTTPEIAFVFGHEMGHYVLHHIFQGMLIGALGLLVLFRLGYLALGWTLRRWGARWSIRAVDDWASLPVLWLWLSIFIFLASPMNNAVSRHFEHQADTFGLEVVHGVIPDSSQVAARAFQILGEQDLSNPRPNPFIVFWLYSHPPIPARVQFALHYDPWAPGRHPRYVGAPRP